MQTASGNYTTLCHTGVAPKPELGGQNHKVSNVFVGIDSNKISQVDVLPLNKICLETVLLHLKCGQPNGCLLKL